MTRTEVDMISTKEVPSDALYGIHALRAKENFPVSTPFPLCWYKAIGETKLACYQTYKNYKTAALSKYSEHSEKFAFFPDEIINALVHSAEKVASGNYFDQFIVPAIQGGAGTSINMNINEIIANVALLELGSQFGNYGLVDPVEHANVFQSTNDVIPTSLRVTVIRLLTELEETINRLRFAIEKIEVQTRNQLRIAYTQMQQAVPSSYSNLFSTYNEALSRDWWRVSKCFERIKVVNLGGSAVGTAVTVPRFFVMEVVQTLQRITGLPITRSENLHDATSNLDTLVEVHAIMKAHAVNLEKMVNDLRLLSSDLLTDREITIPQKQAGSSIMPGKVNPVIPEFVVSVAHIVYSNDMLITSLAAQGCLDLNAYTPVIGYALIESLELLLAADNTITDNLINGLQVNKELAHQKLLKSPSLTTALIPYIGYHKAGELAELMKSANIDLIEANNLKQLINKEKLLQILEPQNLLKMGYSLNDLL